MNLLLRLLVVLTFSFLLNMTILNAAGGEMISDENKIVLPKPRYKSTISVEEAILKRRSVRSYIDKPLKLEDISQLLWSAQGITDYKKKFRAAPSAGALFPLEVFLVVGNVNSLKEGIYRYDPFKHGILMVNEGDFRNALSLASLGQSCVKDGAISIVISAVYERITGKYGERGIRYSYMEAGHAAQNIYLQAEALELGTVVIGAFIDDKVKEVIGMKKGEDPLYILPVGKK